MMNISNYIVGAGGHCRAVINLLKQSTTLNSIKIIDIGDHPKEKEILNIEVIRCKAIEKLEVKNINLFCAIGDNKKRINILKKARKLNYSTPSLISKSAYIDNTAKISDGSFIGNLVYVGPNSFIGKDCIINTSSVIEHETKISDGCHIAPNATICGRVSIDKLCFLGAGATVIDNISIAENSLIGAGATVVKNIKIPSRTWTGVPANVNEKN